MATIHSSNQTYTLFSGHTGTTAGTTDSDALYRGDYNYHSVVSYTSGLTGVGVVIRASHDASHWSKIAQGGTADTTSGSSGSEYFAFTGCYPYIKVTRDATANPVTVTISSSELSNR